ncbi:MAG: DUF4124 domain-containing protein [Lysobacterales bacterium]
MNTIHCARWVAALAGLALGSAAVIGHAGPVYKCVGLDGHLAYQDTACAEGQHQHEVTGLPVDPPRAATATHSTAAKQAPSRETHHHAGRRSAPPKVVMSWECRAADGEVFYRHSRCPGSIRPDGAVRAGRHARSSSVSVTATPIPRTQACQRLRAAGAIGRDGRARDESVSTYDRNRGQDPCRRY